MIYVGTDVVEDENRKEARHNISDSIEYLCKVVKHMIMKIWLRLKYRSQTRYLKMHKIDKIRLKGL